MRYKVSSKLGNYWNNFARASIETEKKINNNMMNEYRTMTASVKTPKYGFAKGFKLFLIAALNMV